MFRHLTCLLALVALVAGCSSIGSPTQDCRDLQGAWRVVSATKEGKEVPQEELAKLKTIRYVVNQHEVTPCCFNPGCPGSADLILDDTACPKAITLICLGNGCTCAGTHRVRGVYTLEGNTFTICVANDGSRPTEVASQPGSINSVYVLQREGGDLLPGNAKATGTTKVSPVAADTKKTSDSAKTAAANADKSKATATAAATATATAAPKAVETKPAEKTITLVDKETKETTVVAANTKIVFPDDGRRFKNGVLEVWFPNRDIANVTAATKKAIAQLGHTETNTSMQGTHDGGSIIFGKDQNGTKYTSTMAAGGNYTLIRIHYGDWGNIEESTKLAYKISDNL